MVLTIKVSLKIDADNIIFFFCFYFSEKMLTFHMNLC